MESSATSRALRIAYVSLQAVEEGQDSWAAVLEIIAGFEAMGWTVDRWFVEYAPGSSPTPYTRLVTMRSLQRELGRHLSDYDAVYVRGHPFASLIARSARRMHIPVIQECNGTYEDLFKAWPAARVGRPWFEHMQRSQLREADGVIAVTEGLAEWVRAETGRSDAVVSSNGANTAMFAPGVPPRPGLPDRYVVFFGQFAPWQGIEAVLEAVEMPRWPTDVRLVVAGDGALRARVEEASGRGSVIYLGRLPYGEVPAVVASSIASLVPMDDPDRAPTGLSPLKLFESMACGVPVIVSDVAGLADLVREARCGIVVAAGDAAAIAEAVGSLASDRSAAREMGERGRAQAVSRHSWRARARERAQVVQDVVARTRPEVHSAPG